jgi:2-hydroxy-3-keto-5-methylthiopentenyl-1-phosphate phosphatase
MLFVKVKGGPDGENDLAKYCTREGISHVTFSDFSRALVAVQSIVQGEKTAEEWFKLGRVE